MASKNRLIQLFKLPETETIFEDFGCAILESIMLHGRMFVTDQHICFYATILGINKIRVINIDDIINIEKKKMLGFIENAIQITTKQTSYFFCSFFKRDNAFCLIHSVWKGEPYETNVVEENEEEKILEQQTSGDLHQQNQLENAEIEVLNVDPNQDSEVREFIKVILPISVEQFFELFYSDKAEFSFADYLTTQGATNLQTSQWTYNEELGSFTREMNGIIKVEKVPFRNTSRLYKVQTYIQDENKLEVKSMNKVLDIPYTNVFQAEDKFEVTKIEGQPQKCLVRMTSWIVFIKSTILKKFIKDNAFEGIKKDSVKWIDQIQKFLNKKFEPKLPEKTDKNEYEASTQISESQLQDISEKNISNTIEHYSKKLLKQQKDSQKDDKNSNYNLSNKDLIQIKVILSILLFIIMLLVLILVLSFFYQNNQIQMLTSYISKLEGRLCQISNFPNCEGQTNNQ